MPTHTQIADRQTTRQNVAFLVILFWCLKLKPKLCRQSEVVFVSCPLIDALIWGKTMSAQPIKVTTRPPKNCTKKKSTFKWTNAFSLVSQTVSEHERQFNTSHKTRIIITTQSCLRPKKKHNFPNHSKREREAWLNCKFTQSKKSFRRNQR